MSSKGNGIKATPKKRLPRKQKNLNKILSKAAKGPKAAPKPRAEHVRFLQCARQYLDPTSCDDLQICPDESSQPRCIRRIPKTFTITRDPANHVDGFTIVAQPRLVSPIWMTGTPNYYPSVDYGSNLSVKSLGYLTQSSPNNISETLWDHHFRIRQQHNPNSALAPIKTELAVDVDGNQHNLNTLAVETKADGIGTGLLFSLENTYSDEPIRTVSWFYKSAASPAWTHASDTKTAGSSSDTVISINVTSLTAVAFAIKTDALQGYTFHMQMSSDSKPARFPQTDSNPLNNSTALSDLGAELKGGRVVGFSMLAQNTTAEISKQGKIYAIRAPGLMSPFTPIEELQRKVPAHHYYDGPAKDGAYTWWFPGEYEPLRYQETQKATQYLDDDAYLLIAVRGWGGAGVGDTQPTFSIQVTAIVEFYDTGVLFEKIDPPLMSDIWESYLKIIRSMPAATCNPAHTQLIQHLKRLVGKAGSHAYDFYQRNPELIHGLYALLTS